MIPYSNPLPDRIAAEEVETGGVEEGEEGEEAEDTGGDEGSTGWFGPEIEKRGGNGTEID